MGRIEEALKRAGGTATAGDVPRGHVRVAVKVDDYPNERTDEYPREPVDNFPREREVGRRPVPVDHVHPPRPLTTPRKETARGGLHFSESMQAKLVTDAATAPSSLEQYRRLAGTLHQIQAERPFKILMLSSALPREGKTLTSVNLALTLSESYKNRVLLIDADLRRPSIHEVFRIPNTVGLGEALKSERAALNLVEVSPRLTILPAGRPDRDPIAGLTSDRMRAILEEATECFDWIIVDTPPVGLISDARLLAALADGVLLVAGAGSTDYKLIEHAIEEIGRDRIIGAVLNRVEPGTIAPDEYYNYYNVGAGDTRG